MNDFYSNNEFDVNKFNKKFEDIQKKNVNEEEEQEYLNKKMQINSKKILVK